MLWTATPISPVVVSTATMENVETSGSPAAFVTTCSAGASGAQAARARVETKRTERSVGIGVECVSPYSSAMTALRPVLLSLLVLASAGAASAQGEVQIARVQYGGGGDWYSGDPLPTLIALRAPALAARPGARSRSRSS